MARLLAAAGVEQRLVVRRPERAPALPGATVAQASYADGAAVRDALTGVDVALMVSGAESQDRVAEHRCFVDAAVAAGVGHVVYLSFAGAAADATFLLARDHHATERHLEASGVAWTHLRDNLYLDLLPELAGVDGVVRGPGGSGRMAGVSREDVAEAAVAVLRDPASHAGRAYSLTGPDALTLAEATATISRVLGRPFSFHDETPEQAYESRAGLGAPPWLVDAWVSTYTAIAAGELDEVTGDVAHLTGHAPRTLAEVLRPAGPAHTG